MTTKLAFLTFGVLHEPVGSPRVQGFLDRAPGVYAVADASSGFQGRSVRDYETWKHSWGEIVVPRCYPQLDHTNYAMTLSLWDDLESVAAFVYKGAHAEALANRKDWFQSLGLPSYVAWWVDVDKVGWQEAADRMDHLHAHGPSAWAFNFRNAFDAEGNAVRMDAAGIGEGEGERKGERGRIGYDAGRANNVICSVADRGSVGGSGLPATHHHGPRDRSRRYIAAVHS